MHDSTEESTTADGTGDVNGRPAGGPRRAVLVLAVGLLAVALVGSSVAGGALGVASGPTQEADSELALSVESSTDAANDEVDLTLTVQNVGDERSIGPVVHVTELPEGWEVVNQSSDEATYRQSTREWLWMGLDPGEERTVTATIDVPEDASGQHSIPVRAHDAADAEDETEVAVSLGGGGGDSTLLLLGVVLAAGVGWYVLRSRQGDDAGTGAGGPGADQPAEDD